MTKEDLYPCHAHAAPPRNPEEAAHRAAAMTSVGLLGLSQSAWASPEQFVGAMRDCGYRCRLELKDIGLSADAPYEGTLESGKWKYAARATWVDGTLVRVDSVGLVEPDPDADPRDLKALREALGLE
jgi:hypothetical protein